MPFTLCTLLARAGCCIPSTSPLNLAAIPVRAGFTWHRLEMHRARLSMGTSQCSSSTLCTGLLPHLPSNPALTGCVAVTAVKHQLMVLRITRDADPELLQPRRAVNQPLDLQCMAITTVNGPLFSRYCQPLKALSTIVLPTFSSDSSPPEGEHRDSIRSRYVRTRWRREQIRCKAVNVCR